VHVHQGVNEEGFVALRSKRDATLAAPTLLLPSIQGNIRAGRLPQVESNGVRYLKVPLRLDAELSDVGSSLPRRHVSARRPYGGGRAVDIYIPLGAERRRSGERECTQKSDAYAAGSKG
jgi:hypothetical protein